MGTLGFCCAQTYWYDNGAQRGRYCGRMATTRTRAMDGSISAFCDKHAQLTIEAGAQEVKR